MFALYKRHNNSLYNKLVELSRNIYFYRDIKLNDTFDTRIILIFLHLSVILISLKKKKSKLPQEIYDNIFLNIEYHLRELGFGDIACNKKMKSLNKIFYDILLKLNNLKTDNFSTNKEIIKRHLFDSNPEKTDFISKISNYMDLFYNFCFELDAKSMVKGKINYKY
ncbi:MAG: hypothetical protein CBE47_04155 [Pelagibacteraceae bacterium TMED287]|nr:MAG: hypothetical protein CBE47_04155 [Pelagibacteraceae bacterium TMED287]